MAQITGIFFQPPLAVARLGDSDIPLESFVWDFDRQDAKARGTVIRPSVTLDVQADGSPRAYVPEAIRFRDGGRLRPVAPFFELWASVEADDGHTTAPVTLALLEAVGASLHSVQYTITVANRKAQSRTGLASSAFIAQVCVNGADHDRKELRAFSPHSSGTTPLVDPRRPIPLGHFQVIRPLLLRQERVDLSALRVRFTPARGEVYGPPQATVSAASPLPPGETLAPQTVGGRLHEIVPERNRILNPNTPWSEYVMWARPERPEPQPPDSYDGANVGDNRSWGVVDDTCDGILQAELVIGGERLVATARVVAACPDFAPDRRPFASFAEDLDDRDLVEPPSLGAPNEDVTESPAVEVVGDLFERAFETLSLMNVDATRIHGIGENVGGPTKNYRKLPRTDDRSMTEDDRPFADLIPDLLGQVRPGRELRYTPAAHDAHSPLADRLTLLDRLRSKTPHVMRLLRPPFGRFWQLERQPGPVPNAKFRDPRVERDLQQDMRMPPYMRDSDQNPLSLSWRQYDIVMRVLRALSSEGDAGQDGVSTRGARPRRSSRSRSRGRKARGEERS